MLFQFVKGEQKGDNLQPIIATDERFLTRNGCLMRQIANEARNRCQLECPFT